MMSESDVVGVLERCAGRRVLNVAVIEHHQLVRRGLALLFGRLPLVHDVVEFTDPADARGWLSTQQGPTIVLHSLRWQPSEVPSLIGGERAATRVCILPEACDSVFESALRYGCDHFLLAEEADDDELEALLRDLLAGHPHIPPTMRGYLLHRGRGGAASSMAVVPGLTCRETEVLEHLMAGLGNKEIAVRMKVSIHAVKRHVSNILMKAHCGNRTELVGRCRGIEARGA